jgi:glyoxylase-like metal-dependent hydrolase (beta-lactamase superfamily II)
MLKWRVGDVTITKIVEAEGEQSLGMYPEATPEQILQVEWLRPHFASADGGLYGSVHALVIEAGGRRIVVDTCCGNDKDRAANFPIAHRMQTTFLRDLESAGYARESIDTVLCTHLHVDHVGWNTMLVDGRWTPTFPNARYLIGRTEFDQWRSQAGGFDESVYDDSIKPVLDAGLVDLVGPDARICDEVWLEPTPGHTKGHVSVRISSRDEQALITGDIVHNPCQFVWPHWSNIFDDDTDAARRTRRRVLEDVADTSVLVIGTHFPAPTAGYILRDGDVYRLDCRPSCEIGHRDADLRSLTQETPERGESTF